MGSTRFPAKVLAPLGDTTVIRFLLKRLRRMAPAFPITVCIPDTADNLYLLGHLLDTAECDSVYRGPEDDVLARFAGAALKHPAALYYRITSDTPLVSSLTFDCTLGCLTRNLLHYAGSTNNPDGDDVEVFTPTILYMANLMAQGAADREHVTPWMRRQKSAHLFAAEKSAEGVKYSIDTERDLSMVVRLLQMVGPDGLPSDYCTAYRRITNG